MLLLFSAKVFGQLKYTLKAEPFGFYSENNKIELLHYYNLQFSLKELFENKYFYEIQTGIILNGFTPHLDFFIGGKFSIFYLKLGTQLSINISGGGSSGASVDSGFLPFIGAGIYFYKNFFFEINYLLAYSTVGIGIEF